MDACVGLYDDCYGYYLTFGYIQAENMTEATREYTAAAFAEAAGMTGENPLTDFSDSDKISVWYRESLAKAAANGVISGYSDGTLRPDKTITKIEALVLLSRCFPEIEPIAEASEFEDVPDWARADIERLSKAGLLKDTGEGLLGAFDKMTVEQIGELIKLIPEQN